MQFTVRALTVGRHIEAVQVDAADMAGAQREAERLRLQVLSIVVDASALPALRQGSFAVTLFAQEIAVLLEAGLSLSEALAGIHDKESSSQSKAIVAAVLARLREGHRLSVALRDQGDVFPVLFTGLVQAAERSSDLARALTRYVEYAQRSEQVRARVVSASVYPALLLVVGSAVCAFLMGYVVPRFARVYQGSGRSLPWMSQLLLDWGQWVAANGMLALMAVSLLIVGMTVTLAAVRRNGRLAGLAARLPGLGLHLRLLELSRLYLTLGTLIEGGMSIRAAIELAKVNAAPASQRALSRMLLDVTQGRSLCTSLEAQGLSTPIATRLLRAGERSGQLGPMFMRAAQFHEAQVARAVERFSRLFEPLLMTAIGLVIGLIVILLYMPIFDLVGSFG
jgi:general secretion pathway protein F